MWVTTPVTRKTQQTELGKRIERRREQLGLSRAEVTRRARRNSPQDVTFNETLVRDLEEGRTRMTAAERLRGLARALETTEDFLVEGIDDTGAAVAPTVPLVGYVGAGAEVFMIDDHEKGAGLEEVEAPVGAKRSTIALRVRGDSQLGRYDPGDIIYFSERRNPEDFVNQREVIVKLEDGRLFLKRIVRGSKKGTFTLLSSNAPIIEDVRVEWTAKIDGSKPHYTC